MYKLLAFLKKYQFTAFFLLLELVSLLMLSNSYSYHKSLRFNVVSDLSGGLFNSYSKMTDYFSLKSENARLLEENSRLRNRLAVATIDTSAISDTVFHYLSARVVSNTVNKANNFLLIDKGELDGVQKEMGVISGNGVAGIVIGTSGHYARVISLLSQNIRISGRIKKNNQMVNVVWDGKDYSTGVVKDIPPHIILNRGDTVVTSGNSLIFPEGILIGTVLEQHIPEDKNLGEATLAFGTDFNSLRHVYLIENRRKAEQDSLINTPLKP